MVLGNKLFEEIGTVLGFKITKVHPVEGTITEVTFASELKGFDKFPSGKNMGSGKTRQYPHGIIKATFQGVLTTTQGQQFMWWADEKSRVIEGGKVKGLGVSTGFTTSKELSWMNNVILAVESEFDPNMQQLRATAYKWE